MPTPIYGFHHCDPGSTGTEAEDTESRHDKGSFASEGESFFVRANCDVCNARYVLCRGGERRTGSLILAVQRVIRDIRQGSKDILVQLE